MIVARVAQRWRDYRLSRQVAPSNIVGIYAQARGGTNFIASALHYHPHIFAVNEHQFDYRVRLSSLIQKGSVYRADGRQDKQIDQIRTVVFNKMQEFAPELWDPRAEFPAGSRFVVYLRNPVRIHQSREAYRRNHKPRRVEWADSRENFLALLSETRQILTTHELLKTRYPSLVITHEHFCCEHDKALPQLHQFLGLEPLPPGNPRALLRNCHSCGREFVVIHEAGQDWLACPRHRRPVMGCGRFNPLRPIDRAGVQDESWKNADDIGPLMAEVRRLLGDPLADYFWKGDYSSNLPEIRLPSPAASSRSHAQKRAA